jgi:hypothetical protein
MLLLRDWNQHSTMQIYNPTGQGGDADDQSSAASVLLLLLLVVLPMLIKKDVLLDLRVRANIVQLKSWLTA